MKITAAGRPRLRNDLYCVEWDVKLYYIIPFKSQPGLLRIKVYSAFHPSGVGKWVPAAAGKAKAGMVHSDCGWSCGCAGKTVKSLKNTCHTWALLRWWFTTKRRYIKCMHLYSIPAAGGSSTGGRKIMARGLSLALHYSRHNLLCHWIITEINTVHSVRCTFRPRIKEQLNLARTAVTAEKYERRLDTANRSCVSIRGRHLVCFFERWADTLEIHSCPTRVTIPNFVALGQTVWS